MFFKNVEFGLRLQGIPAPERETRVTEWLQRLEISDLRSRYSHQLSGGQAQRVALARALVVNFPVLLLDEPFAGLDTGLRDQARTMLKKLAKEKSLSMLLVTHDPEDTVALADQTVNL